MSTYLLINIAIIIFPLLASFEPRFLQHIKNLKAILASIILVGIPFVAYDMLATAAGFWSFNPTHVGSFQILNIPIEEVLFFITAPFSCLFVYECICYFFKDRSLSLSPMLFSALAALLIAGSILALPPFSTHLQYSQFPHSRSSRCAFSFLPSSAHQISTSFSSSHSSYF